jgi:hypothetical protein
MGTSRAIDVDEFAAYELMGPLGQTPAFTFEGGEGRQMAAMASSGSRDRIRGAE